MEPGLIRKFLKFISQFCKKIFLRKLFFRGVKRKRVKMSPIHEITVLLCFIMQSI